MMIDHCMHVVREVEGHLPALRISEPMRYVAAMCMGFPFILSLNVVTDVMPLEICAC